MNQYTSILGFQVFNGKKKECLKKIFKMDRVHIISGNPEVLYTAKNNPMLTKELKEETSIIIPDGIGIKIAAKMKRKRIDEKIAGIELMVDIIDRCAELNYPIYLLGSTSEVVNSCKNKLIERNNKVNIVGTSDGFFNNNDVDKLINKINNSKAKALFVAMGCPKQEEFISKNKDKLNCKIYMGVGGSFDVISGKSQRAPEWMISLGLEWLFRVSREPKRIVRLAVIPKFLMKDLVTR